MVQQGVKEVLFARESDDEKTMMDIVDKETLLNWFTTAFIPLFWVSSALDTSTLAGSSLT